jgi:hypothetical protein
MYVLFISSVLTTVITMLTTLVAQCILELQDYAVLQRRHGFLPALDAGRSTILKSDTLISEAIRSTLVDAAAVLEATTETQTTILDLIDPWMYCFDATLSQLIVGHTIPCADCVAYVGRGFILPPDPLEEVKVSALRGTNRESAVHYKALHNARASNYYQWLPCEVAIDEPDRVRVMTYINNAHPDHHRDLYHSVELIIAKILPMWDKTLELLTTSQERPLRFGDYQPMYAFSERDHSRHQNEAGSDKIERHDGDKTWFEWNIRCKLPSCEPYRGHAANWGLDPSIPEIFGISDLRRQYADKGLQVFVRLFNIHLTPEQPVFAHEPWHMEGLYNEHICACTYYCYASDNVTQCHLAFRDAVDTTRLSNLQDTGMNYNYASFLHQVQNKGPALQELGQVKLSPGRLVTFPNTVYHRLTEVELKDRSRAGHVKFLVVSLVDPNARIFSTANVPPQQHAWWADLVAKYPHMDRLPTELQSMVVDANDMPVRTLQVAQRVREGLRRYENDRRKKVEDLLQSRKFDFGRGPRQAAHIAAVNATRIPGPWPDFLWPRLEDAEPIVAAESQFTASRRYVGIRAPPRN